MAVLNAIWQVIRATASWIAANPWYCVLFLIAAFYLYCVVDDFVTAVVFSQWTDPENSRLFSLFDRLHQGLIAHVNVSKIPAEIRAGVAAFVSGYLLPLVSKEKLGGRPAVRNWIFLLCGLIFISSIVTMLMAADNNSTLDPPGIVPLLNTLNAGALYFSVALLGSLIGFRIIGGRNAPQAP